MPTLPATWRYPKRRSYAILLSLATIVLLVFWLCALSFQRFRSEAETVAKNFADLLSENIDDTILRTESDLRVFAQYVKPGDIKSTASTQRREDIESLMDFHLSKYPQVANYRIFSAKGDAIYSAGRNKSSINVIDREWFATLRDEADKTLVISDIVVGKGTKTFTIIIAIPVRASDGRFLGAVNAALDLSHFQQLIDRPAIGTHGVISVRRSDTAKLLFRKPEASGKLNEADNSPLTMRVRNGEWAGVMQLVFPIDNVERLTAFKKTPNYPIVVIVGLALQDVLHTWVYQTAIAAVLTLLLCGGLGFLLLRIQYKSVELERSEARHRALFERSKIPALMIDPSNGSIVDANQAAADYYGYARTSLCSMQITAINQMSQDEVKAEMALATEEKRECFFFLHRLASGEVRQVEVHSGPLEFENRLLLYSFVHDITDRKKAEAELDKYRLNLETQILERDKSDSLLRRESHKNQLLLFNASDGIHILDRNGNVIEVSNSFCRMLGYDRSEVIGMNVHQWDVFFKPEELNEVIAKQYGQFDTVTFESRHRRKDGSFIDVEITGHPLELDGQMVLFNSSRNITDRILSQRQLQRSEAILRGTLDASDEGVLVVGGDGAVLTVNKRFQALWNIPDDLLSSGDDSQLLPYALAQLGDPQEFLSEVNNLYGSERSSIDVLHFKDGRVFERYSAVINLGSGNARLWSFRDITKRVRAEEALRIAAIAFESQEGIFITDTANVILRVNEAFSKITGYTAEEVLGQTPKLFSSGRHDAAFYADMNASLQHKGTWQGEIWNRRKNGEVYPESLMITAVKDSAGVLTNYVAALTDVTFKKAAEERINNLAFYDPLTQLPNRRLLLDRLKQALVSSSRSKKYGALLFIDLDNFKTLNDTLGHHMGDLLLQQVALRLRKCVREVDSVARLGGDEFVVMLEELSEDIQYSASQCESIGEKILASLNQTYQLESFTYHCTPSIGVALFADNQESVEELLKRADLAMYQAKAAGRNTFRFFDPEMQVGVTARAALEADLGQAVDKNQFSLYYQAQVVDDGRLTGAEALLRWRHPGRGLVSPAQFISLAEETGQILPIGLWVLETACHQLAIWSTKPGMSHLTIAVNVSAKQFHQKEFVEQVSAVLDRTGASPQRLKLELTESLLVNDLDSVIAKMTALKAKGVGFSLDDFGTGYSSLSYLKRLPLDQLKIDQSFVRDILVDSNDAAIAKMVIALGSTIGLAVIAEGVEIEAQKVFLAQHGCNAYQGYLFSRPLPVEEFEEFARQQDCDGNQRGGDQPTDSLYV